MSSSEDQLESLSRKIEQRELHVRRRVLLWTLIPILVAGLFLLYTVWQIANAEGRLNQAEATLSQTMLQLATADTSLKDLNSRIPAAQATVVAAETTQAKLQTNLSRAQTALAAATAELSRSQSDLATTTAELGNARVYASNACQIQPEFLKNYMGNDDAIERKILLYALELQQAKVRWNEQGSSVQEGFDSPRFALFVLQHVGRLSGTPPNTLLWNILQSRPEPMDGDIVHYEAGYTMFYYRNLGYDVQTLATDQNCVIGMTPLGIQVLKVNFANILEYLKLPD